MASLLTTFTSKEMNYRLKVIYQKVKPDNIFTCYFPILLTSSLLSIAAQTFEVKGDADFKVTLKDNHNIILSKSNFVKIIENYSRCADFYVKLELDAEKLPGIVVITPDVSELILMHFFGTIQFN